MIVYAWRDRNISHRPGLMSDGRHLDGWKEVFSEVTALCVAPRKCVLLDNHKMVHEFTLGGPEKVAAVNLVDELFVLKRIAMAWLERWWVGAEYRERSERVAYDIAYDAKALREVSHDWSDFLRDWLVFLLRR